MSAKILCGLSVAKLEYAKLTALTKITDTNRPGLAVVLVGQDPASSVYVQRKQTACERLGFYSEKFHLPDTTTTATLIALIERLNHAPLIHGILVQLPLPTHINTQQILAAISPDKDVDGFHPYNLGRLAQNQPGLRPCTPAGIITLLEHIQFEFQGAQACVVGASTIVGRPMSLELLNRDATVTICHRHTQDLMVHLQQADLVIVAIGKPQYIQGAWLKPGATVIDVGINRLSSSQLVGDVNFQQALGHVAWITPVPGGVGPMTVCTLLKNTYQAWVQSKTS